MNTRRSLLVSAAITVATSPLRARVPTWGDRSSQSVDASAASLRPGEWVWNPEGSPRGPMVVLIALDSQRAFAYRNGVLIGYTTVSTGKAGHVTPTGVFTTLQKDKDHHSKTYNNAAMPYTQRLTWDGIAMHAGGLPGYPSSHGCIHLPSGFAQALFDVSPLGMTVVIADRSLSPAPMLFPTPLSAAAARSGTPQLDPTLADGEAFRWWPERAPTGPVSIVLSAGNRRVLVMRNGVEIGRARIDVTDPDRPLGTHVLLVRPPEDGAPAGEPRWMHVGIPGHGTEAGVPVDPADVARVSLPPAFLAAAYPVLSPGTAMLVTDALMLPSTTGTRLTLLTNQPT